MVSVRYALPSGVTSAYVEAAGDEQNHDFAPVRLVSCSTTCHGVEHPQEMAPHAVSQSSSVGRVSRGIMHVFAGEDTRAARSKAILQAANKALKKKVGA